MVIMICFLSTFYNLNYIFYNIILSFPKIPKRDFFCEIVIGSGKPDPDLKKWRSADPDPDPDPKMNFTRSRIPDSDHQILYIRIRISDPDLQC